MERRPRHLPQFVSCSMHRFVDRSFSSFVISLKKEPSLCVAASANAVNASVVIDTCSPKAVNQTWSDPSNNGQVVIFDNLCITASGELINNGTKITPRLAMIPFRRDGVTKRA